MAKQPPIARIPSYAEQIALAANVVGYWPLDADLNDDDPTASDLSGTLVAGFFGPGLRGAICGGVAADSPGPHEKAAADASLQILGDMTLHFLIGMGARNFSATTASKMALVEMSDGSGSQSRYAIHLAGASQIRCRTDTDGGLHDYFVPEFRLEPSEGPHWFAMRRSGTALTFWVDGVNTANATLPGTPDGTGTTFGVGRNPDNTHRATIGAVCVRSAALSDADMLAAYELHLNDIPSGGVTRSAQVGTVLDFGGDLIKTISLPGGGPATTAYTITPPTAADQGKVLTLEITPTTNGDTISVPATVDELDGASLADRWGSQTTDLNYVHLRCVDWTAPKFALTCGKRE